MKQSISDYALPVYRSLSEHHQLFGVGEKAFYCICMLTIVLASMVSIFCIALGVIALAAVKQLCKKDPLLIDFIFENLNQANYYRG